MDDPYRRWEEDPLEYEDFISWIGWFTEMKGNEFFCVVDREYIEDDFNLIGLSSLVGSSYHYALDLILDMSSPKSDHLSEEQQRMVESAAETLYGLIHARFITSHRGLKLMEEKFMHADFGTCPRVLCSEQAVLPVGVSDELQESSVKLFCPKCQDIYHPRSARYKALDGAFWGTSFPHLLLLQMRERGFAPSCPARSYVPRIYGFRIHKPAEIVAGSQKLQQNTQQQQQQQQQHVDAAAVSQENEEEAQ
eukprot:gene11061-7692_t